MEWNNQEYFGWQGERIMGRKCYAPIQVEPMGAIAVAI